MTKMPVEISVKNKERIVRKGKLKLAHHFLIFLIAFLACATYFSNFQTLTKLGALVGIHKNFLIKYRSYTVSFDDSVPVETQTQLEKILGTEDLEGRKRFEFTDENAQIVFSYDLSKPKEGKEIIYSSFLVPVGHLYWIKDGIVESDFEGKIVTNSKLTSNLISSKYNKADVSVAENIEEKLMDSESSIGLVDISELTYSLKLLTLNGKYFLDDQQGAIQYYFVATSKNSYPQFINKLMLSRVKEVLPTDFNKEKLAKVNMTGVTAITRALATKTDNSGNYGYASQKISQFLKDADLTHVSNEVSFVPGCTPVAGVRFCSKPEYIKTLEDSGVDIVELTGNHNNDYGASYNEASIEMYKDRGWDYFGGGLDDLDASKILYKEVNGNKVAFIGYNYYDTMLGTGALAGDSRAGANSYSETKMKEDIEQAKETADIVIVDFQFQECYSYPPSDVIYPICYKPLTSPDQSGTFRKAVDFGADIVVGTQAHQPQTYEIYNGKLIFYGLGNLYFDQIYWVGTRHGLILTHYVYDGKLIQTKITTTNYGNDMQTYVSSGEERELLLQLLSDAR